MSEDEKRRMGEATVDKIVRKIREAKKVNPLRDNPPKIIGEKHKHVTWGQSKNTNQGEGKHRKK